MQSNEWQKKFKKIMRDCQDEITKATLIGKKMITATQTNSDLHEHYQELGKLAAKHLNAGLLEWENPRVDELLKDIEKCKKDLMHIENEVQEAKKDNSSQL